MPELLGSRRLRRQRPACGCCRSSRSSSTPPPASAARRARWRARSGTICRRRRPCRWARIRRCPTLTANFWNLIKFREHERTAALALADAQGPVHALHRAGLPHRLPRAGRHRPVHQRHRRLPAGSVHRLRLLHDRLPVQRAEVQPEDPARLQVHDVRGPRVGRPAAGVREGVSRRAACSSAPRTRCWKSPTSASIS